MSSYVSWVGLRKRLWERGLVVWVFVLLVRELRTVVVCVLEICALQARMNVSSAPEGSRLEHIGGVFRLAILIDTTKVRSVGVWMDIPIWVIRILHLESLGMSGLLKEVFVRGEKEVFVEIYDEIL